MADTKIVVVGAGIGGLSAAVDLAARGFDVCIVERSPAPGGKMRVVKVAGHPVDSGPTVLTLREVFDALFEHAGESLDGQLRLVPAQVLARHAWVEGGRLDLFADVERSASAIGELAGPAEGDRYLAFCRRARGIFETLDRSFIRAPLPNPVSLSWRVGLHRPAALWGIQPFRTLWGLLGEHFRDPRLRQLFGRYATYCGSSPFAAPATLALVAHVEQAGVWFVEGGMQRLAAALAALAARRGAEIRYGATVARLIVEHGRIAGVALADGSRIAADAVVLNADSAALAAGLMGGDSARAVPPPRERDRSLSAVTWSMHATARGFPLLRHTVFFSSDYPDEFDAIFRRRELPLEPTVYVCAQDRGDDDTAAAGGAERLMCLVNAPPVGDAGRPNDAELDRCEERTFSLLERCGLSIERHPGATVRTGPADFERLFPATGGALYGRASHGWRSAFARPGSRSKVPGLYLAGGSIHPGPGVPMAAVSGRLAAASLAEDLASTSRSRTAAMPGGTSTR
jgi:1-hydroxycarotenoid 3,4-desaturase